METRTSTANGVLLEALFRERRRRVLRAEAGVVVCVLLGLGVVIAAKTSAPDALGSAVAFLLLATLGSLLVAWRTACRHWRCPACNVRWPSQDALASFYWNHCHRCGTPLLLHPTQRDPERAAFTRFAMEALPHAEVVARFERRRRHGLWIAGAITLAGLAALAWMQDRGYGELSQNVAMSLFFALGAAGVVWGVRCPRCRTGVVTSRRHCQRCGLQLTVAAADALDPRA